MTSSTSQKKRRRRTSGIVVWDGDDIVEAERIEKATPPEVLAAAIAKVESTQKDPVPGLVVRAIHAAETQTRPAPKLTIIERNTIATPAQIEAAERMRERARKSRGGAP